MALETAITINQLDPANPSGPDRLAQGDDHLRLLKQVLKNTFPNITGPMTLTNDYLNSLAGLVVPVGTINLWYGTTAAIPAGWALCNGQTVNRSSGQGTITTPDMRGRVPQGAVDDSKVGEKFGQDSRTITSEVAGAHTHTGKTKTGDGAHSHPVTVDGTALTLAQMPKHNHSITVKANSGTGTYIEDADGTGTSSTTTTGDAGNGEAHTHTASTGANSGVHVHDLTLDGTAGHSHTATVDVVQASIALHYIMRV